MNNTCPSCGAVYNVAAKDIGRKIKCKKCNTPLVVSDAGLVVDAPSAAAPFAAAAVADDFSMDDDAVPSPKGARKAARPARSSGGGLDAIGGVPTILFGLGTFLVIFFAFMPLIGEAATSRAKVGADKLSAEVSCTLRVTVGNEKDFGVQEMRFQFKKIDGEWLITRVETVKTLT